MANPPSTALNEPPVATNPIHNMLPPLDAELVQSVQDACKALGTPLNMFAVEDLTAVQQGHTNARIAEQDPAKIQGMVTATLKIIGQMENIAHHQPSSIPLDCGAMNDRAQKSRI